ncbi:hypothetical protein Tco_1057660 [Tanacetum coccineum]|uniref:Uncharacterized protein n=1 Tax=Tanacetum coccineum TaxID=301880 RepID=A0ABQ5H840_9ASTR
MGEPLSPDRVYDFPMDEPHPAYDFFAPAPLPGYAGNPNNNNGWLAADDYLLGELGAMVDEQTVVPVVNEIAEQLVVPAVEEVVEPVVEAEEEQDDASNGFGEEEVWEVNEDWLMAPTTPPPVLAVPPPSVYEVGGPSTTVAEKPSFPQLVQRVNQVSDVEVAVGVTIGEIGPRVLVVEGQIQVMASQMIQVVDRMEQVGAQVELGQQTATQRDETVTRLTQQVQALQIEVQQRDMQIQQLQTIVSKMSSRESSLMQCILGLDKRIAALERKPPGPQ